MKKREFLKLSAKFMAVGFVSPWIGCLSVDGRPKNWAGNFEYGTNNLLNPKSSGDVQSMIMKQNKLKALGSRHCFNHIADSKDCLLSTENLNQIFELDRQANTVTVGGGIRFGELSVYLHKNGFALHNLASLPHISVAGSCITATHGSGTGNLGTAITALEMITASGETVTLTKEANPEEFNGAIVSLGALGVITKVTLRIQPTFDVRQHVYLDLPFDQLKDKFDEIMTSAYSVSLFTDWQDKRVNEVWVKSRINPSETFEARSDFYGAKLADRNVHPVIAESPENCTEQMGVPGPWHERLPHFRMGFTPSSGKELQCEYFVPRDRAYEAIVALEQLQPQIKPHILISEIRTVDADEQWMSPCYKQDSVTFHFTWKQHPAEVEKLLPLIEEKLAPFDVKPHWGKLFTIKPEVLKSRYSKLSDFQSLVKKYDPQGKFRNEFLDTYVL